MREGWTNKRIGELCTIIGGSTPKTEIKEYWGGENYWVTPAELNGNKYQGATTRTITNLAVKKTNLQLLPVGTVLLSSRAPIGKVAITTVPMYCNQGFKNIVCPEGLLNEFVYWYLFSRTDYLNSLGTGATFKEISKKTTENIIIPVPPFNDQERIVAELDLLTGIIDKQKAQLQELDTLAQSIFYDMFGDPVENEKGWEMYEIASVCDDLFAGGDKPKDFSEEKDDDYKYPIIGNGDGERGILGYSKSYRVGKAAVTIGARGASIGNCRICEPHFTPVVRLITLVPNKRVNLGYLYAISRKLSFNVNGAGQAQLTTPNVANKLIPVPPRELQDSFAQKIQSIESQKASINRSIAETQKLFDYTMDKYFG